jgi:hypothetical protein
MRVVAWYLPDLKSVALDYTRVARAMTFRTKDGHRFDSFALDIESPANRSVAARNKALLELSGYMRRLGGPSYPLGAIIPSPKALANPDSYWHDFPYASVARTYDAFVPMSYYSWHGDGEAAAYADTLANVRVLRSQKGCANVPIHMIGGLVEGSTPAEVRAFVRGNLDTHTIGASLYEWAGTRWVHWKELSAVRP